MLAEALCVRRRKARKTKSLIRLLDCLRRLFRMFVLEQLGVRIREQEQLEARIRERGQLEARIHGRERLASGHPWAGNRPFLIFI